MDTTTPVTDQQIRKAYGLPVARSTKEVASLLNVSLWRVRKALKGHLRGRGNHLSPAEVARRKAIAATVWTWKDYTEKVGVANARMDRRFGFRLLCFVCRKRLSTTAGWGFDPRGSRRQVCRRCFNEKSAKLKMNR